MYNLRTTVYYKFLSATVTWLLIVSNFAIAPQLLSTQKAFASSPAAVATDKGDYAPGDTAYITGSGFAPGEVVTLQVTHVTGEIPGSAGHEPWDVNADGSGSFESSWYVQPDDSGGATLLLTATGNSSGYVAETTFTDAAAPSANLDQCGNDPAPSPNTDGCSASAGDWVNGNLGASKSYYLEGDSIPYRMKFDNLSTNASHVVIIKWDTTKGDKHDIDYLTTFNRTVADANPCLGIASCNLAVSHSAGIPVDPQVSGAGVTPIAGVFTLYGGHISSVGPSYSYPDGSGFSGDKSASIAITFTATVADPVLAWGGHISTRADWGPDAAATAIPGSPYHMHLVDLDGKGGSQDRSLSADAVVFPGSITVIKDATPNGSTSFSFIGSPSPLTNFSLVDDGTSANTKVFSNITDFQTYQVSEVSIPSGWGFDSVSCGATSPNGGSSAVSNTTATINMKEGENWTCTYLDSQRTGSLKLSKVLQGGPSSYTGPFTIHYDCGGAFVGDKSVTAGSFETVPSIPVGSSCTVSEPTLPSAPSGYTFGAPTFGPTNPVTITTAGATVEVTTTNTLSRDVGSLKISKVFNSLTSGFAGTFAISYDCDDGTTHDGTINLAAGGNQTISGIPTGTTCTVSEPSLPSAPTGWTFGTPVLSDSQAPTGDGIVVINDKNITYEVTVTNSISRDLGSLKISKVFDKLTSGFAGTFDINYDCSDGTAHDGTFHLLAGAFDTVTGIPTGTVCTVSEPVLPAAPTGWTFGTPVLSDSEAPTNDGTVTITTKGATYEVTVTNSISRDLGNLKITKVFDPLTSGFVGNFDINYDCNDGVAHDGTFHLAAGGFDTVTGIPTGTVCTVSEPVLPAAPTGWTFGTPVLSDSQAPTNDGTVTITTKGATYEVTVTNSISRDLGNLKISKVFDPLTSGFVGAFDINYDCNDGVAHDGTFHLAAGGFDTVTGIPTGTLCTVSEPVLPASPIGWTFGTPLLSDNQAPVNDGIVTITSKGVTYEVSVTNYITRDLGSLVLAKALTGGPAGYDGPFQIDYSCDNGASGFRNVVAGLSETVSGIPTGTICTVTETPPDPAPIGYTFGTPTYTDSSGTANDGIVTIPAGNGSSVTVTTNNTLTKDQGYFKISKVLNGTYGGNFQFDYECTDVAQSNGTIYLAAGKTSDDIGPIDTYNGLTAVTCYVVETLPDVPGYLFDDPVYDPVNQLVTITKGATSNVTLTVTNTIHKLPTLTIIKNAKPQEGSFEFTTQGDGYGGFTLTGSTAGGGNKNKQTLLPGTYTAQEGLKSDWLLTGIGGSTAVDSSLKCYRTDSPGTPFGDNQDLSTHTISVRLAFGDDITCVFENTKQGVTRTQGFWATHSGLAEIAWFGGTYAGHTFKGVAGTTIGDRLLCGREIDDLPKLLGGFWSDVSKKTSGAKRSALDQARMQLLQQLLAAELNYSAFSAVPTGGLAKFTDWEAIYCGTNQNAIKNAQSQAASFNTSGDSGLFTPGTSADAKNARAIANRAFWDTLP